VCECRAALDQPPLIPRKELWKPITCPGTCSKLQRNSPSTSLGGTKRGSPSRCVVRNALRTALRGPSKSRTQKTEPADNSSREEENARKKRLLRAVQAASDSKDQRLSRNRGGRRLKAAKNHTPRSFVGGIEKQSNK